MTQFLDDKDTIALFVVGVIIAIFVILQTVFKIWPFLSRFVTMVNEFVGYGDEPGLSQRVKNLEHNSEHESRNHDKMSQQFDRVEQQLATLNQRLDESAADRKRLWEIARTHHTEIEE